MDGDPSQLTKKRHDALQRLRDRRGESRRNDLNQGKTELDQTKSQLKHYISQEKLNQVAETPPIKKSRKELEPNPTVSDTIGRLKENIRVRRASKKKSATDEPETSPSLAPLGERQQLISDLLSADFLRTTQLWLSSVENERELSSTPIAELEDYHKRVKYRFRVLKVLLEDTEHELDRIEVQIRAIKGAEQS